ncbi:MAG: DUF58 domain-containing protein [Polyangiales bacterium]
MPSLSAAGKLSLAGGVALTLGGVVGAIEPLMAAGHSVLVGLALAWVATVPIPRRMRRERLEFSWWTVQGARRPDEALTVRIALRNPTKSTLTLGAPRLSLSPGLKHARWKGARIELQPESLATFDIEIKPGHAGRHVLHGAWMTVSGPLGLAWAPLYFPNPLVIEVGPRSHTSTLHRSLAKPDPEARAGRSTRRYGEGAELRELREHQPGDPFHRIAWKASARRGRLLVRETEDDAQTTRVLIVDVGPSMRGDPRGGSKLDYAIELCAQAARSSRLGGDRLGLVTFDSRVTLQISPGSSPAHLAAIVAGAIDQRSIVDEDLTDLDDEQLDQIVARYFREQEGVEVKPGPDARERLARLAVAAGGKDPVMKLPVRASDEHARTLRAFCRARGILLPLRYDSTGLSRAQGLQQALEAATHKAREPRTIIVLSDLDPFETSERLRPSFAAARAGRHRVSVVAPMGVDFAPASEGDAGNAVRDALLKDDELRVQGLRQGLARAGVPLYFAKAKDPFAHWLARASAPRVANAR